MMLQQFAWGLHERFHGALVASREFLFGPRLLVCAAMLAAAGTAVAAYHCSIFFAAACCAVALWLGMVSGSRTVTIVLMALPCLGYFYCELRHSSPALHDLNRWIETREVIFIGRIIEMDGASGVETNKGPARSHL